MKGIRRMITAERVEWLYQHPGRALALIYAVGVSTLLLLAHLTPIEAQERHVLVNTGWYSLASVPRGTPASRINGIYIQCGSSLFKTRAKACIPQVPPYGENQWASAYATRYVHWFGEDLIVTKMVDRDGRLLFQQGDREVEAHWRTSAPFGALIFSTGLAAIYLGALALLRRKLKPRK